MPPAVSAGRCPSVSLLTLPASWADTWNATQVAGLVFFILLSDNFHDLSAYQPERAGASTWSQDSLRTADRIPDMTEMFLARSRRFPSDFWVRLSGIVEVLIAWFFPETRKSHRTCGTLEVLLMSLGCCPSQSEMPCFTGAAKIMFKSSSSASRGRQTAFADSRSCRCLCCLSMVVAILALYWFWEDSAGVLASTRRFVTQVAGAPIWHSSPR